MQGWSLVLDLRRQEFAFLNVGVVETVGDFRKKFVAVDRQSSSGFTDIELAGDDVGDDVGDEASPEPRGDALPCFPPFETAESRCAEGERCLLESQAVGLECSPS